MTFRIAALLALTAAFDGLAVAQNADLLAPSGRWTAPQRGATALPPMGWNSWNAFATDVDEEKVMASAQALVDTGLAKLGYRYVNIDDGWWLRRDADGRLVIRTGIFPSAAAADGGPTSFRPFTDRLHAMGLKAGIYTDIGLNACSQTYDLESPNLPTGTVDERQVGMQGHVDQDIALFFRDWGFDYIKVDSCGIADYAADAKLVRQGLYRANPVLIDRGSIPRSNPGAAAARYREVADALDRHNPDGDYILSICAWGGANARRWGMALGGVVRSSQDIRPLWSRMLHTFDSAARRALYAQPGAWNDPDILFIGTGDFDAGHLTEARSHFALWAMINAPLLIGYDLRKASPALLEILGNRELVALNQDRGGHQAVLVYDTDELQILVKELEGADRKAVAILNRGLGERDMVLTAAHLGLSPDTPIRLKDVWSGSSLSPFRGDRSFRLRPRETLVFLVEGERAIDGRYLSELPGRVHVAVDGVTTPLPDPFVHRDINPWAGTSAAPERLAYGGWGGAMANQSVWGGTLQVRGTAFDRGIGILANSRLEIRNAKDFRRFKALVGVDDNSHARAGAVRFELWGDGKRLAQSNWLAAGAPAEPIAADISGVEVMEMIVRQQAGASSPLSVVWGEAALLEPAR